MQMVDDDVNNFDMMGLSSREMEIIDLVADGLTNQEIAVKLTISKRTVDNHVSNMFTKTGSKNRVALLNDCICLSSLTDSNSWTAFVFF